MSTRKSADTTAGTSKLVEYMSAAGVDGSNICRACDWRPECQRSATDFTQTNHRCMPWAREDESSVLFKRVPPNAKIEQPPTAEQEKGTEQ